MENIKYYSNLFCRECNNHYLLFENGYIICSRCGLVLISENTYNNFIQAGLGRFKNKKNNQDKKKIPFF